MSMVQDIQWVLIFLALRLGFACAFSHSVSNYNWPSFLNYHYLCRLVHLKSQQCCRYLKLLLNG